MKTFVAAALLLASPAFAQLPHDPFPQPIEATQGVVRVNFAEFASTHPTALQAK